MDVSPIRSLADRQHGIVTAGQVLVLGWTSSGVDRLVRSGVLQRVHRGVYAFGHRRLTEPGMRLAAAWAVDSDRALVARYSAAHHMRLTSRRPSHGLIEVAVPAYRGGARQDIKVVRLGSLTESDRVVIEGVPCTSPGRTIVDLASVLGAHDLGKAIREADFRGLLDRPAIAGVIAWIDRPRGVVQLRELLGNEPAQVCDTILERRLLRLILDAGLTHPVLQQRFVIGRPAETIKVDFWWPDRMLVVEADGPHHELPSFALRDEYRDAELKAQGIHVHRVPQRALDSNPAAVAAQLVAVYRSRA